MTLKEEIIIRKYREDDKKQIIDLLDTIYGGWPKLDIEGSNTAFWEWKYEERLKPSLISVAEQDGRVVGMVHARQLDMKIMEEVYPCTTTGDLAVHKDYRGMGLSKKLGIESNRDLRRKEGTVLDYFIVGNPILVKSFERSRPKFPVEVINLVKIEDISLHFEKNHSNKAWYLKFGYRSLSSLNNLMNYSSVPSSNDSFMVSEVEKFHENVNDFWDRIADDYDLIVERTESVLNYRYCHDKNPKYTVLQATCNGNIQGFIVLRINSYNENYPVGYIIDLLGLKGEDKVIHTLLQEGLIYFKKKGINLVNIQLPKGHPYVKIANAHGFLDSRVKLHIFYIPAGNFDPIEGNYFNPERVYLSWGDHDVLPASKPGYE